VGVAVGFGVGVGAGDVIATSPRERIHIRKSPSLSPTRPVTEMLSPVAKSVFAIANGASK
jgi:hypothetical protein